MLSMRSIIFIVCLTLTLLSCERQGSTGGHYSNRPNTDAAQQDALNDAPTGPNSIEVEGSPLERQVVLELNKCRTNPPKYAEDVLEPFLDIIHGKLIEFGGEYIQLQEGCFVFEEAINVLKATEGLAPLTWSDDLYKLANDHCKTQGLTEHIGHDRESGEDFFDACSRFNLEGCGENIDYGYDDAKMIVIMLLVDDGVPSRGHRGNMLRPNYNRVGVSCGPHKKYRHMCVIDFQEE
jgi:hypothetical protein